MSGTDAPDSVRVLEAVARLLEVAGRDTGQSRRVADFLLAWHNAEENGRWDPTDLWSLDMSIAQDIVTILCSLPAAHKYPGDLGFEREMTAVWQQWRSHRAEDLKAR